ncbi:MAG: BREX system P-loop protein BrxC [Bacteroidales bacterium]|nr:BREX system P-loop protein BrxC [Bacteroidales bacterium]
MTIKEFFSQDINRNIETVIKADDRDHILQEVEEYVVTKEISKKIRVLFSDYIDYSGANGVWISGFFGSGKSHLLKILSYVLENREYNGFKLGEVFAGKIENDEILRGDVLTATRTPSESILFNIDQQAQITSKKDEDAILNVFYKVFNDHLGYFGAQRHIAEFERWLDGEGVYKKFRDGFEIATGESWENGRRKYFAPKIKDAISKVLGTIYSDDHARYSGILDTLQQDMKISVDDFSQKVLDYIKTKPKGFRLNFFVDEVGQYISDNTKLMLNLQTLAETLAVKTKGQSWVFVTSQEDIEKVVGDMTRSQQNDFSKIMARFKYKIPLSSANVDEVIERRLLNKNELAQSLLSQIWHKENANLETLLSFSEVGVQFRHFKGEKDFIGKYPFIPYQFDLFQQCIRALSVHNAFQGKHASVGERSMLGVFQEVVKRIEHKDEKTIVSYDLLFEGIRSTMRGEVQNTITLAENNLGSDFAIKVLKALFLVKYYSNFKTTARNITVLMIDSIHVDLKEHESKIREALGILEAQTYIQRNGELYEFLTDEEKDIEEEIKSMDIDNQQVTELMKEIIFDEIIQDSRIRYLDNKQDYEFTSRIDGVILGREKELAIEILTPNSDNYGKEVFYTSQTMGYNTLMMLVLPQSDQLMRDIRLYLKTNKYIKQSQSTTNNDSIKRILFDKGQQNGLRRRDLVNLLRRLLGEADVYLNGTKHPVPNSTDGKNKVINSFQDLIRIAYPSLRMLGNTIYSEDTIKNTIRSRQDDLFGTDDQTMSEAEIEIFNLVIRRKKQSDRTSLTEIREHFSRKPYGWYPNSIWSVAARLFKRGKIEFRQDSNQLTDEQVLESLMNNRLQSNTLLEPQAEVDPQQVRRLKEIYSEMFDESCPASEAKEVTQLFRDKISQEWIYVNQLMAAKDNYPFLSALESINKLLERLSKKDNIYLLSQTKDYEDELLDAKEDILHPIKKFWNGEQKKIYDSIRVFFQGNQSNLEYIEGDDLETLKLVYNHSTPYSGNLIRDAKTARENLMHNVLEKIETEKTVAIEEIQQIIIIIKDHEDFSKLDNSHQARLIEPFEQEIRKLKEQKYIANIHQARERAKNSLLEQQLNELARLITPPEESGEASEPKVHYIRRNSIKVEFPKTELRTEQDVLDFIETYKKELLKQIRENRRISL